MLSDGPDVSLSGSPMVSPITAALCGSDPFGPRDLACSEAPAYNPRSNLEHKTHDETKIIFTKEILKVQSNAHLNVFLGVIPCTTGIGCRDSNLQMQRRFRSAHL